MVTPEVVGHIDRCVLSSLKTNGKPGNRRAGLVGGADVIQRIPPYSTSLRTSKPRVVAH
jgi:hypothetical protein